MVSQVRPLALLAQRLVARPVGTAKGSLANHAIFTQAGAAMAVRGIMTARPLFEAADKKTLNKEQALKLMKNVRDRSHVDFFVNHFDKSSDQHKQLALVKIGGAVIEEQMDELVKAVDLMLGVGAHPVILHGGGPQLNRTLKKKNIEPVYVDAIRKTDKQTLTIAEKVFAGENKKIVDGFKAAGLPAVSITSGTFNAKLKNFDRYNYVGEVTGVNTKAIEDAIQAGHVPIVSCMGENLTDKSATGGDVDKLNINADTSAAQLAKVMQPWNVVYLNTFGGLNHPVSKTKLEAIDVVADYDRLMKELPSTDGTMVKIREIRDILSSLPADSCVTITSTPHLDQILTNSCLDSTVLYRSGEIKSSAHPKQQSTTSSFTNVNSGLGGVQQTRAYSTGNKPTKVGIIGARGYVGREVMNIINNHPNMEIECVSSRQYEGMKITETLPDFKDSEKAYVNIGTDQIGEWEQVDAWVLALPNGLAEPFVQSIGKLPGPERLMIDLSADYRFTDEWTYGFPERFREQLKTARRISNPGCYATGMQVALWPLKDVLAGPAHVFGVSGYSGAGTNPSPKNDPSFLSDNIVPYTLLNHIHEREVSRQLDLPLRFSPHVAQWFQGISLTVQVSLKESLKAEELAKKFQEHYQGEPLIKVMPDMPVVRDNAEKHYVVVGGFTAKPDEKRAVLVATIDNLLKGAATQCIQNMNLALGYDEFEGIDLNQPHTPSKTS
eukprot:Clim_evm26s236 gene=Clim_evmTU26s236